MASDKYRGVEDPMPKERAREEHDQLDERITRNERYRLQAQGALKILALILGAGGLTYVIETTLSVL